MPARIVLVRPAAEGEQEEFREPLGIESIAAFLLCHGHECVLLDRQLEHAATGDFCKRVMSLAPDIVGFSVMTAEDMPDTLRLVQRLSGGCVTRGGKRSRMVAGGLFITTSTDMARALFPKDVLLLTGEGEAALLALADGKSPDGASPNGTTICPDAWAMAYRPQLEAYLARSAAISVRSARGCPGGCAFCSTPSLPGQAGRYCPRSISLVADEVEMLAKRVMDAGRLPVFDFVDDCFGELDRVTALTQELNRRDVKAAFSLELRAQSLCSAELSLLKQLKHGGLCRVFTGLESINAQTQRYFGKPIEVRRFLDGAQKMRRADIELQTGYILWHPLSSAAGAREEMRLAYEHGLFSPKLALSRLMLYPGSRLYEQAGMRGGMKPAELAPDAYACYEWIKGRLSLLYELWVTCAAALAYEVCRAHLTGDASRRDGLRALLREINDRSYAAISEESDGLVNITDMEEKAHALCRAGNGGK